ncbi:MAG TPA: low specificity L-threonine aldolase [Desulfocapsa sulfexigens]|nr:low specificity L-threonine aldolase [Desulfocapsa sulfexigens]
MQFGSDNQAGASQQVLETLLQANTGFTHGYGEDQWCAQATEALKKVFGCELDVFFVATGTAANSLALSCLVQPWETILCHHHSHILLDESTAPEFFSGGARLVPLTHQAGKLESRHLEHFFQNVSPEIPHTPSAKALSITQTNEAGQVYTVEEVATLSTLAHDHGLHVHMDGARFANAVASLACAPADISWKAGVDVLTLGATKCGALAAEAVIFFNRDLSENFIHRRKRSGHLISKGRLFGAQFIGWLKDDHWLDLAKHANSKAQQLADTLETFSNIQQVWPCQANELFLIMSEQLSESLQTAGAEFYQWPVTALPAGTTLKQNEVFVRLVTSFATTDEHITEFCDRIRNFVL